MWGRIFLLACFFLPALAFEGIGSDVEEYQNVAESELAPVNRTAKKFLSVFTVVNFVNGICNSKLLNTNGTCYTAKECDEKAGTHSGTCAGGFGICCVFNRLCNSQSSENNTYFSGSGTDLGACVLKICKCNPGICQLRLDFDTFVINGPETTSITSVSILAGGQATSGQGASIATQCVTDTFSVSNPGGSSPPVVCGTLTGDHMYVDASDACNDLAFHFGSRASTVTRSFSMKISQIPCAFRNKAPSGCTQWFYGGTTGTIQSFNFANSVHLANQNQKICIRRERGFCRVCYSATAAADFSLTGTKEAIKFGASDTCGGYGTDGKKSFDCLAVSSLSKGTQNLATGISIQYACLCGNAFGTTITITGTAIISGIATPTTMTILTASTYCTKKTPFIVRFLSNNYENVGAAALEANGGFRLNYELRAC